MTTVLNKILYAPSALGVRVGDVSQPQKQKQQKFIHKKITQHGKTWPQGGTETPDNKNALTPGERQGHNTL